MTRFLAIADDLTGAAEIAGVGHRYGLESRVLLDRAATVEEVRAVAVGERRPVMVEDGLTVYDLDSRPLAPAAAGARVTGALRSLRTSDLDLIYLKTDSVLRGPVLAHVEAALEALGFRRAILVPANPSRGRSIAGGVYRIGGTPLQLTEFARDPEHPARTADVLEMLGPSTTRPTLSLPPGADLPAAGVIVGDASSPAEVEAWAARIDEASLPAGAADFLGALLRSRGRTERAAHRTSLGAGPVLIVSGSASAAGREALDASGIRILSLPAEALEGAAGTEDTLAASPLATGPLAKGVPSAGALADLAVVAAGVLAARGRVAIVAGGMRRTGEGTGARITAALAAVTRRVLELARVEELFVEGGATASALVRESGWTVLRVAAEFVPGLVRLSVPGANPRYLTLKPGSYPWPEEIRRTL